MQKTFEVLCYQSSKDGGKEFSHKYTEIWSKTDLYCPNCGKQDVWMEEGRGDYYLGVQHICPACESEFYLPIGPVHLHDGQDKQRLRHLSNTD